MGSVAEDSARWCPQIQNRLGRGLGLLNPDLAHLAHPSFVVNDPMMHPDGGSELSQLDRFRLAYCTGQRPAISGILVDYGPLFR